MKRPHDSYIVPTSMRQRLRRWASVHLRLNCTSLEVRSDTLVAGHLGATWVFSRADQRANAAPRTLTIRGLACVDTVHFVKTVLNVACVLIAFRHAPVTYCPNCRERCAARIHGPHITERHRSTINASSSGPAWSETDRGRERLSVVANSARPGSSHRRRDTRRQLNDLNPERADLNCLSGTCSGAPRLRRPLHTEDPWRQLDGTAAFITSAIRACALRLSAIGTSARLERVCRLRPQRASG